MYQGWALVATLSTCFPHVPDLTFTPKPAAPAKRISNRGKVTSFHSGAPSVTMIERHSADEFHSEEECNQRKYEGQGMGYI